MSHKQETIAERFDPQNNSLNFIRLTLAALVIVAHSTPIGGFSLYFMVGDFELGRLAVAGFFGISGYLITRSRTRTGPLSYTVKRAARIFPGYWACLIVTAFAFAVIVGLSRGGWQAGSAASYVLSNLDMSGGTQTVGATLSGVPFPATWNGSLWTLRYEVFCYAAIGVALAFGWVRRNRALIAGAFVASTLVAVALTAEDSPPVLIDLFTLTTVFLAGAALYFWSERVPLTGRIAAAAAATLVAASFAGWGPALGALPIAYLVIYLGVALPTPFRRINSRNDISYGVYLYGFPVQQGLALAGAHNFGHSLFVLVSLVCVLPFAWVSWLAVEKPAMSLANKALTKKRAAPAR